MRLTSFPENPLPSRILGGLDVDSFLAEYLLHSTNPLAIGLGFLSSLEDETSLSSTVSQPWSVCDPHSSFYNEVFELLSSVPGPALPSEAIRSVPRLVKQQMITSGVQNTAHDSIVDHVVQTINQVSKFLFSCLVNFYLSFRFQWCLLWVSGRVPLLLRMSVLVTLIL